MSTVLYGQAVLDDTHRAYGFCAKCGDAKDENRYFVHGECTYPEVPGAYHYCAACGQHWDEESRCYVCNDCLIK